MGCLVIVGVAELGAGSPVVTDMQVDVVLVAQPVGRMVAVDPQPTDIDDELQRVELGRLARTDKVRFAADMNALDPLDLRAGALREPQRAVKKLVAAFGHLPPPAVERSVDQNRRAGGAEEVGAGLQDGGINQVTLQVEH